MRKQNARIHKFSRYYQKQKPMSTGRPSNRETERDTHIHTHRHTQRDRERERGIDRYLKTRLSVAPGHRTVQEGPSIVS